MTNIPQTPPILAEAPPIRRSRVALAILKWAMFIIVLAFVVHSLWLQLAQIDWKTVHFNGWMILLAGGCLLLVPPVQLLSYRTLLGAYAHAPPLRVMAVVAWIPPLGKYVPGKVVSLVGAVYILRKFKIPAAIAVSVVLAMDGLAVMSGMITGCPLLQSIVPGGWIPAVAFIIIGVFCLHPAVFGRLLNFVLIRSKRQPLDHMPDLRHYLIPVLCAFSQWVLAGLALWCIARSVASVSVHEIPRFMSIAGLGYTISYLALFAPGGLGPREYIFQKAMQAFVFPAAMSAVAVVAMRVVQTSTELTAALVAVVIMRGLEREMAPQMNTVEHG